MRAQQIRKMDVWRLGLQDCPGRRAAVKWQLDSTVTWGGSGPARYAGIQAHRQKLSSALPGLLSIPTVRPPPQGTTVSGRPPSRIDGPGSGIAEILSIARDDSESTVYCCGRDHRIRQTAVSRLIPTARAPAASGPAGSRLPGRQCFAVLAPPPISCPRGPASSPYFRCRRSSRS